MASPVILAVDQGTTSVRASILDAGLDVGLDAGLNVLASRAETVPRSFPRPGWVEVDAEQVVSVTERVAALALEAAGRTHADVAGLGLANQGETVLVWDRATGRPIAPAIVWQCRRTEAICARLREDAAVAKWVREATGLPLDPYFSATKIAWLLDHTPGARARAERGELVAGTLDTFTLWRLSGGAIFVTDPSTACRTLLAELDGRFSDRLCELFQVPRRMLARVVPSDADLGPITIAGGRVPARALLCDQPSALLGTGCVRPGDMKCTYGTGAFLQVNTGLAPSPTREAGAAEQADGDGLLRSIAWEIAGERTYLLEGSVLAAGDVLAWLRDGLGMIARPEEVDDILATTADSAGVLFIPALTGLGAPRWVGGARGSILGLHRGVRREHLIRAALEGIAHQVADVIDVAARVYAGELAPMWADGGLAASLGFLALQADLSGRGLLRADECEATTRGVAAVAAVGAGLCASVVEAARIEPSLRIQPRADAAARERARDRHRRLVDLVASPSATALVASGAAEAHDGEPAEAGREPDLTP